MFDQEEINLQMDKIFFRNEALKGLSPEETGRLRDRWAIEDAASTIASAIRSSNRSRRGWFF